MGWPPYRQRPNAQCHFERDPFIALCPIIQTTLDPDAIAQSAAMLGLNATVPLDTVNCKFEIMFRSRRSIMFNNRVEGR